MLKQKYFLTGIFILSAERQPIKLAWRKIVWLQLTELEMEGLIQRFEYTFELAWKVLQDLLKYKGYEFVQGPNGTLQKAFEDNMITDHDGWRRMAKARIATSHTYNDGKASEIVEKIYTEYSILLKQLAVRLGSERSKITGLFA